MTQIILEWQTATGSRQAKVNSMQTVTIGRHPGCDIVLGDAHVSRRHASVSFWQDCFHLHNHSKTNPIIFNDRWSLAHDLKADLKPGDTFTIGLIRITVGLAEYASPGPSTKGQDGDLHCPSCGREMPDKRATCPECRVSIAQLETMFMTQDS